MMNTPGYRHIKTVKLFIVLTALLFTSTSSLSQETVDLQSLEQKALRYLRSGNYDSSLLLREKLYVYYAEKGDQEQQVSTLLAIAESYRKLSRYEEALEIIDSCLIIATGNTGTDLLFAKIYQLAGTVYLSMKELDTARYLLERSISNLEMVKKNSASFSLAKTYNNLGNYFFYQRDLDSALLHYEKAYRIAGSESDTVNEDFASACQNMGIIYANKGFYVKAERYMHSSLAIKKILYDQNSISLARTYFNIANFYFLVSKIDSAYNNLKKAERIYKLHFPPDSPRLAHIYHIQGNYYLTKGDFDRALTYFQNALNIYENYPSNYKSTIQTILNNIGFLFERKNQYSQAIQYYQRAIEIGKSIEIIRAYRNIAKLYSTMEEYEKANSFFDRSIIAVKEILGNRNKDIALCYLYYGESLLKQNKKTSGFEYLFESKEIFEEILGKNNRDVAKINTIIGNYYRNEGIYDSALFFYQRSIISSVDGFQDPDIHANPDYNSIDPDLITLEALIEKAYTHYLKYRSATSDTASLYSSYNSYNLNTRLIDTIRNTFQNEESKLFLSKNSNKIITDFLATAFELYSITGHSSYFTKMIELAEWNKASLLMDALREANAHSLSNIPEELLEKEEALQLNIGFYSEKIHEESNKSKPDSALIGNWKKTLFKYRIELEELKERIAEEYPLFSALKYSDDTARPDEIRKSLDPGETVIEYVLADTTLYIFIINNEHSECISSSVDTSFFYSIEQFHDLTKKSPTLDYQPDDFIGFINVSNYLYQKIIQPANKFMSGNELLIIPDAELNFISFDLLLKDTLFSVQDDYKGLSYLINDHTIRYSYSLSFESFREKNENPSARPRVLAFAPEYDEFDPTNSELAENYREVLLPLPYAEEEVGLVLEQYPGKSYKGAEANEENFIEDAPDYEIIHLAMHTLVDRANPLFSKLVFTTAEDSLREGFLNIYELYNMELNGNLAVLSACNTGSGKLEKGEGIMSLARAFMYAGIPSVVMTLWTVEDRAGSTIMGNFYNFLGEGMEKHKALRGAKLEYLENANKIKSHPYFWGGYVCIGDESSLRSTNYYIVFIISPILLIIIVILIWYIRRKKSPFRLKYKNY